MTPAPQIGEFGIALLFILTALIFILGGLLTNRLLSPSRPNPEKLSTYECGEDPVGNARIQINMRYYSVALLFLLFDAELIFLFPWALVSGSIDDPGLQIFIIAEGLFFLLVLVAGLAYAWLSGDLDWVRPRPLPPAAATIVPASEYEKFNERMKGVKS